MCWCWEAETPSFYYLSRIQDFHNFDDIPVAFDFVKPLVVFLVVVSNVRNTEADAVVVAVAAAFAVFDKVVRQVPKNMTEAFLASNASSFNTIIIAANFFYFSFTF